MVCSQDGIFHLTQYHYSSFTLLLGPWLLDFFFSFEICRYAPFPVKNKIDGNHSALIKAWHLHSHLFCMFISKAKTQNIISNGCEKLKSRACKEPSW